MTTNESNTTMTTTAGLLWSDENEDGGSWKACSLTSRVQDCLQPESIWKPLDMMDQNRPGLDLIAETVAEGCLKILRALLASLTLPLHATGPLLFAPLRSPSLPFAPLRSPSLPFAPLRSPSLPFAPLRSPSLPFAPLRSPLLPPPRASCLQPSLDCMTLVLPDLMDLDTMHFLGRHLHSACATVTSCFSFVRKKGEARDMCQFNWTRARQNGSSRVFSSFVRRRLRLL